MDRIIVWVIAAGFSVFLLAIASEVSRVFSVGGFSGSGPRTT